MLEAKKLFLLVLVLTRAENAASKASRWGATASRRGIPSLA